MTDQELAELAAGAKSLSEQEKADLRAHMPPGPLKSREGFIDGVRAARALLDGAGGRLAHLEALAARDLLDFRLAIEEYRASGEEARDREALERLAPEILAGKMKGVPMDEVIRQAEEAVRAAAAHERKAG